MTVPLARDVVARSLRLVVWGLLVSNIYWLAGLAHDPSLHVRYLGVLQRIGLAFFAAALLYLTTGWRVRLGLAVALLVAYWPLVLLPQPDGQATDLLRPGLNFVSWFDRAVLGVHAFQGLPFDPEGILSTLPTIGQCLLGVLAGEWMLAKGRSAKAAADLIGVGLLALVGGLGWAVVFPPVKALWTSSYVLISTGVAFVLLGALHWALDVKGSKLPGTGFVLAFGVNAIFAYVLHELASIALQGDYMRAFFFEPGVRLLHLDPRAAELIPVAAFILMLWLPLNYLYRRGWIIKV